MINKDTKNCLTCGIEFKRAYRDGFAHWKIQKYCSKPCSEKGRIGSKHSELTKRKISETKFGSKNPSWKGDEVGYTALHRWVHLKKPKPLLCDLCKLVPPCDAANISGKYLRIIDDWEWLCRKCHMKKDGRLVRNEKGQIISYKKLIAQ